MTKGIPYEEGVLTLIGKALRATMAQGMRAKIMDASLGFEASEKNGEPGRRKGLEAARLLAFCGEDKITVGSVVGVELSKSLDFVLGEGMDVGGWFTALAARNDAAVAGRVNIAPTQRNQLRDGETMPVATRKH